MSASLSPALSALLAQGEEATNDERNEKLEAATRAFSKLMASVHSGKADPSVLDGLINGNFDSSSSAPASAPALAAAPATPTPAPASVSNPKVAGLANLIEASPDSDKVVDYFTGIIRGATSDGQRAAIEAIANKASGYEVDDRTGELKAVKERDNQIRDLRTAVASVANASGVHPMAGESYKDHGQRMANEIKKQVDAASAAAAAPKTAAMPKSVDTTKAKAAIKGAKDLLKKGEEPRAIGKGSKWIIDLAGKDKVLKDLDEAETSL